MASGIAIADKCMETYNSLSKRQFSVMVLKINETMTEVNIEKTLPALSNTSDPEAEWKSFVKDNIPENDCRFIITDFSWKETPTVLKSKICMILWSPEYAPIRSKMIYASSQEAVCNKMPVQRSIQATELEELNYQTVKDAVAK